MARIHRALASTAGPVLVVGTGLIGTSVALSLRSVDVSVYLWDLSPVSLALATDMGAGTALVGLNDPVVRTSPPRLVIVAAPPDVAAEIVADCLRRFPSATVTDVASVKTVVADEVQDLLLAANTGAVERSEDAEPREAALERYVGSHPMAGRENAGASYANGDLFVGRPWIVTPTAFSAGFAVTAVRDLAVDLGAVPLELEAQEHDEAVALVSHVPQLVASLLAAQLVDVPRDSLSLAGAGLRDTTRIAASDPRLWTAIIAGNAPQVRRILSDLRDDLDALLNALPSSLTGSGDVLSPGLVGAISTLIRQGNEGVQRIPGKHGSAARRWGHVEVLVPDAPGQLGRLFSELGAIGVNMEDLVLEHSASQPVGLARLMIDPAAVEPAVAALTERGWRVASHSAKAGH